LNHVDYDEKLPAIHGHGDLAFSFAQYPDKVSSLEAFFRKAHTLSTPLDPGKVVIYVSRVRSPTLDLGLSPKYTPLISIKFTVTRCLVSTHFR